MTNKLRSILAVSALAVSAASLPAFAAESDAMRISVPFAFKAGKASLPAGDYVVAEDNSGVITIRGNGHSAMLLSSSGPDNGSEKVGISFSRNDQGYVLKSVHAWGKISSSILPITPAQEK